MPVSREEYQQLVKREMARFRTKGLANANEKDNRDAAVRAANIAAGYGNSTALKYPVGRISREGASKPAEGGGQKLPGKAPRPTSRPGAGGDQSAQSTQGGLPNQRVGRLSDEYVAPGGGEIQYVDAGPGRMSPEYVPESNRNNPTVVVMTPPTRPVGELPAGGGLHMDPLGAWPTVAPPDLQQPMITVGTDESPTIVPKSTTTALNPPGPVSDRPLGTSSLNIMDLLKGLF